MLKQTRVTTTAIRFLACLFVLVAFSPNCLARSHGSPAWFVSGSGRLLTQKTDKSLSISGSDLAVTPRLPSLYGAAYYPEDEVLITVEPNATVKLYRGKPAGMKLTRSWSPPAKARVASVHFTRVPGLAYMLWYDVAEELRLRNSPQQMYPDRFERIALGGPTGDYDAFPIGKREESLLGGYYQVRGRLLTLFADSPSRIRISLPDALARPFRSGPGDSLAQAVFFFPGSGIVCRTVEGWSLHRMDGSFVKWFPTKKVAALWWRDPTVKNGHFYVHTGGPIGDSYEMDIKSAKLVRMKKNPYR